MELTHFIIWLLVIIFAVFIINLLLFNPKNYTQKITESDRILWSLIVAIFVTLIFGLIMKPYITYNYCSIPGWLAILGYRPTCGNVSSFILWVLGFIAFLLLILSLINSK